MILPHRSPSLFTRSVLSGAILGALACLAQPALAQTSATPVVVTKPAAPVKKESKPEPAPPPVAETGIEATVTVTGNRPTNRIDRQVYDVKNDVSATNSSAADALNNVPSVAVDPDGTVTLRGSTKVQVYIDGKPSAMMQGDNRGATLNALPAEDIESVEVINNPGAQFGNEGGGGPILNLVMRRNRKPGGFGAVSANAGTAGRYNSAAVGQLQHRPLRHAGRRQRPPRRPQFGGRRRPRAHRPGHRHRLAQRAGRRSTGLMTPPASTRR